MPDQRQWFRVVRPIAVADGKEVTTATIHINDAIGADLFFGGVDAAELIAEIDALAVDQLDVRINSEGGSAFDGLAIANAIIRNPATTTTYIDGLAASAASLVALAGDTVVMSKYGQMMLHNSSAAVRGSADDLRAAAKVLDSLNESMAEYYADRAGGEVKDWSKAMARESWYSAAAALEAGLVTEVDDTAKRADTEAAIAAALARPTARFEHTPQTRGDHTKAAAAVSNSTQKEAPVADKKTLAESLGLSADAADEDVLKAARDALGLTDDDSADDTADGDAADSGSGEASPVGELAAAAANAGLVLMDPAKVAELQAGAAAGAQALANQVAAAHAAVVDDAIAKGKITPARREHFRALMKADEKGTTELLAGIPNETAVPMTEVGHSLDPQASADGNLDDPRLKDWKF